MNILQLCCFTDLWHSEHNVESIDLKNGQNIFDYPDKYANEFDLVCAAPPCNQFTIANNRNWTKRPELEISIAEKCFNMCLETGLYWWLENPIGRIETFLPALKKFRVLTWTGSNTNKQYNIYANFLILQAPSARRGKISIVTTRNKRIREMWNPQLIKNIESCLVSLSRVTLSPIKN
jgi:hypothetical protein